ncbi:hypothetical protein KQI89_15770 [Clostridium sp. MSJ-4]|uniref:Uncharacterized protein n=1 Tax=Clostridium simiarum TaxID=2841506 RepID=A0ABS6F3V6_9CLOT|nr:hypothetical protein [Clostridium simiarum]MBU5593207.1 hypothetical protein [Clostridium simiarum]
MTCNQARPSRGYPQQNDENSAKVIAKNMAEQKNEATNSNFNNCAMAQFNNSTQSISQAGIAQDPDIYAYRTMNGLKDMAVEITKDGIKVNGKPIDLKENMEDVKDKE